MKTIKAVCLFGAALFFFISCATVDTKATRDFQNSLWDTVEIGYGIGRGENVKLLGKIDDKAEIDNFIENLRFGGKSETSSARIFDKFIFFMNKNRATSTMRIEDEKVQYQFSEYTLHRTSVKFINSYFKQ